MNLGNRDSRDRRVPSWKCKDQERRILAKDAQRERRAHYGALAERAGGKDAEGLFVD